MASKAKKETIVRALVDFVDARTSREYHPGDVVVGWEGERAKLYADRGLVEVVTEEIPAQAPLPEPAKEKPGPKETKPATGASKKK
jgi:hypothetical protein